MGSLATWGAIGGVGKGMQMNIDYARTKETQDYEEAREKRLIQLAAENAQKTQERQFGHEDTSQDKNITAQKDITGQEITGRKELQTGEHTFKTDVEQPFTASESAKDRASAERRTQMTAETSGSGSHSRRFEPRSLKDTRPSAANPRMSEEFDQPAIFDNATGTTYKQIGDTFVLPGDAPPAQRMRASRADVAVLEAHPESVSVFLNKYHYLPIEYYNAIAAQSAPSSSTSRRTTDSARGSNAMDVVGGGDEGADAP